MADIVSQTDVAYSYDIRILREPQKKYNNADLGAAVV